MAAFPAEADILMRAQRRIISGGRLHLHDGPIDLIIGCDGAAHEISAAHYAAWQRFVTVLDELCRELPLLRSAVTPQTPRPHGRIARLMRSAVQPFACDHFITPMAAVAGAVAQDILAAMIEAAPALVRAYVNNGGDIALHLAPDAHYSIGMIDRPDHPSATGIANVSGNAGVRGIATSGWRGRSFSLGIADAVTVLAETASQADAAATIIANAINLPGDARIRRAPASARDPQSDLGERLVTVDVPALPMSDIAQALAQGEQCATRLIHAGLIHSAALHMQGITRIAPPAGAATRNSYPMLELTA